LSRDAPVGGGGEEGQQHRPDEGDRGAGGQPELQRPGRQDGHRSPDAPLQPRRLHRRGPEPRVQGARELSAAAAGRPRRRLQPQEEPQREPAVRHRRQDIRRLPVARAKLPTPDELKAVGRQLGMTLSDDDVKFFLETMGGNIAAYHAIEAMVDPMPPVKYPRTPGYRPQGAENKYNAWYYKSEVQGAPSGKLRGKGTGLKTNAGLAGVPRMTAAWSLEGTVPDVAATIVRRMLAAAGTIPGRVTW